MPINTFQNRVRFGLEICPNADHFGEGLQACILGPEFTSCAAARQIKRGRQLKREFECISDNQEVRMDREVRVRADNVSQQIVILRDSL